MNFFNLLGLGGGRGKGEEEASTGDARPQGMRKGNKREREVTYSSSSGEEDGDGSDEGEIEQKFGEIKEENVQTLSPSYSQTLPQHGGKLLIKNCLIWQWIADGILADADDSSEEDSAASNERIINGELIAAKYLLVDHYGRITHIISQNNETVNEHLFETVIEGRNRVLLPGLIDAHIHVMLTGENAYYLDLFDCHSIQEMQHALKNHHEKNPELPWIIGVNWDQTNLSRYPTRYDLDAVVPDTPVFLWRACWHIGVANTLALRKGGIDLSMASFTIPGGEVEVNASGPTGILKETAVKLVLSAQSLKTEVEREQFIKEGLELCLKSGLTGVQTNDDHSFETYRDLSKSGNGLPLRVFLTPLHEEIVKDGPVKESGPILSSQSLKPKNDILMGNESDVTTQESYLIMDRVKIFTDGSLGAETAAIAEVRDEPILSMAVEEERKEKDYRGILLHSSNSLTEMVRVAKDSGFRLEIHCIGDKAADQTLSALEKAGCSQLDRPVMTHCQVLNPDLIQRMKNIGAIANVQPSFVPTDMRWVMARLAPSQIENSYCWKTLLQHGVWVAGGSDSPIETYSPFRGMYDAIFRVAYDCDPDLLDNVFRPSERLTFDEALWLYTIGAAYAAKCEHVLGRIEKGFAADLVMVDPLALDDCRHLKDLEPDLVIVGGDVKYIHPAAGSKGIIVDTPLGVTSQIQKRIKPDPTAPLPQRGPYVPGKNGPLRRPSFAQSTKGLPRIGGFCACWLKGKFCEEMKYCQPSPIENTS